MTGQAITKTEEKSLVERIADGGKHISQYVPQKIAEIFNDAVKGLSYYLPRRFIPNSVELNCRNNQSAHEMGAFAKVLEAYSTDSQDADIVHKREKFIEWTESLAKEDRELFLDVCDLLDRYAWKGAPEYLVGMTETLIAVTDKSYEDLPRAIETFRKPTAFFDNDLRIPTIQEVMDFYKNSPETVLDLINTMDVYGMYGDFVAKKCLPPEVADDEQGKRVVEALSLSQALAYPMVHRVSFGPRGGINQMIEGIAKAGLKSSKEANRLIIEYGIAMIHLFKIGRLVSELNSYADTQDGMSSNGDIRAHYQKELNQPLYSLVENIWKNPSTSLEIVEKVEKVCHNYRNSRYDKFGF